MAVAATSLSHELGAMGSIPDRKIARKQKVPVQDFLAEKIYFLKFYSAGGNPSAFSCQEKILHEHKVSPC